MAPGGGVCGALDRALIRGLMIGRFPDGLKICICSSRSWQSWFFQPAISGSGLRSLWGRGLVHAAGFEPAKGKTNSENQRVVDFSMVLKQ
jgi:hypothetical protein